VTQSVQAVPGGVGVLGVSGAALARPQGFSGAVDVKIGLASTVLPSASTPKLQAAASPTSIIVPGVQVSESIGLKAELKNGRRMPVERDTRDDGSPDDTDDLDELGNPRRDDNRGGPDDVSDEWGGRGGSGNDVLFSARKTSMPDERPSMECSEGRATCLVKWPASWYSLVARATDAGARYGGGTRRPVRA